MISDHKHRLKNEYPRSSIKLFLLTRAVLLSVGGMLLKFLVQLLYH